MKTKIRIQETESRSLYKHMYIQILFPRYKGARNFDVIGTITFQMTVSEPENEWYAMCFGINTDHEEYIKKMYIIAKYIKDNRSGFRAQPDEIIRLIGGEEHILFDSDFIPVSHNGMNIYNIIKCDLNTNEEKLYDKIIAPNEIVAQKMLNKQNIADVKLVFHKKIVF